MVAREIARHAALRSPSVSPPEAWHAGEPDHRLEAVLDRATLFSAMRANVDPSGRAMLVLHHLGDMRVDDVAEALDVPVGTVKVKLARSRAALATELGDKAAGHVS